MSSWMEVFSMETIWKTMKTRKIIKIQKPAVLPGIWGGLTPPPFLDGRRLGPFCWGRTVGAHERKILLSAARKSTAGRPFSEAYSQPCKLSFDHRDSNHPGGSRQQPGALGAGQPHDPEDVQVVGDHERVLPLLFGKTKIPKKIAQFAGSVQTERLKPVSGPGVPHPADCPARRPRAPSGSSRRSRRGGRSPRPGPGRRGRPRPGDGLPAPGNRPRWRQGPPGRIRPPSAG